MSDDIFNLLMLILMLENGGGTESINQLVIMFLLMNSKNSDGRVLSNSQSRETSCCGNCGRADGYTF